MNAETRTHGSSERRAIIKPLWARWLRAIRNWLAPGKAAAQTTTSPDVCYHLD